MAANPQTKPTDFGCESTDRLLSSADTIAIYYYNSARKLILILPHSDSGTDVDLTTICLKLSVFLRCCQSNPYIDEEADDEEDDDDYDGDGSEDDEDSEKDAHDGDDEGDGGLSDAENVEGPEAGDDDAASVESLHLHLDTEDVDDTQCKTPCRTFWSIVISDLWNLTYAFNSVRPMR